MPKHSPIIIVEDDPDDCQFLVAALTELKVGHMLECFEDGAQAFHYLQTTTTEPFLIISDINMPVMNGLELREKICNNTLLKEKATPFVFISTSVSADDVKKAYEMSVQGYFQKSDSYDNIKESLKMIIDYWSVSKRPGTN